MAHLFYLSEFSAYGVGEVIDLQGSEAHHAATVSRIRVGEEILLGDGQGNLYSCRVEVVSKQSLSARVTTCEHREQPVPRVTLVQALAKGDRDERAIEAATELGVDCVIPWQAERSVSRWDAQKALKGQQRWSTVVREASKQSLRAWIPEVKPLHTGSDVAALAKQSLCLVLTPGAPTNLTEKLQGAAVRDVTIVVGPEGGLNESEIETFSAAGASLVGLGAHVLRTSTAGPAVIAISNELLGRWA